MRVEQACGALELVDDGHGAIRAENAYSVATEVAQIAEDVGNQLAVEDGVLLTATVIDDGCHLAEVSQVPEYLVYARGLFL